MLYIIGLGLNEKGISTEGLAVAKKCKKVYLESYTVEFPYNNVQLEEVLGKKVVEADREKVENLSLVDEAKRKDVALLVYGSPLFATTHITLIDECKKSEVKYEVIYSASVFDALGESGLQLYKFGKIASIPEQEVDSWKDVVKENQKIDAHSLILVDIGLEFSEALKRIGEIVDDKEKIVVCSKIGTEKGKIVYGNLEDFEDKNFKAPFCFVVPGKLHFLEEEVLEGFG